MKLNNGRRTTVNISEIRLRILQNTDKLKAVASITIDDVFVVHDIKLIDGEKGMFIAMPNRKTADNSYKDIAHPITPEARQNLQDLIIEEYEKQIKK